MNTKTKIIIFLLTVFFAFMLINGSAQSNQANTSQVTSKFHWPEGKKMALSLTFDDARLTQTDKGIPLLDKYGVKATFYILPGDMELRLDAWKKAVKNGHEIGNHTVEHPCTGNYDWSINHALENYSIQDISIEIDSANKFIKKELGIQPVSFAYPCGQTYTGRGKMTKSYVPLIAETFETGRGYDGDCSNNPLFCDMSQLICIVLDGKSFDEVKKTIESAKENGQWLILGGHEINQEGDQTSLIATIEAICKYATDSTNGIWIDNIHNVATYVKKAKEGKH